MTGVVLVVRLTVALDEKKVLMPPSAAKDAVFSKLMELGPLLVKTPEITIESVNDGA